MRLLVLVIACLLMLITMVGIIADAEASSIHYTYKGNRTGDLYTGGYLHFPKSLADYIKVQTGGIIEEETNTSWKIKVNSRIVNIHYIELSNDSFSFSKKRFEAKEYPAELVKPVKKNELRVMLKNFTGTLENVKQDLKSVKGNVKAAASKPTAGEQLMGFLLYYPPLYVVYAVLAVLGLLALLGKRYG